MFGSVKPFSMSMIKSAGRSPKPILMPKPRARKKSSSSLPLVMNAPLGCTAWIKPMRRRPQVQSAIAPAKLRITDMQKMGNATHERPSEDAGGSPQDQSDLQRPQAQARHL